jgi:hypothetical protein
MDMKCHNCLCWVRITNQKGQVTSEGECRARSPKPNESTKKINRVVTQEEYGCVHDFVPKDISIDDWVKAKFEAPGGSRNAKTTKARKQSSQRNRS